MKTVEALVIILTWYVKPNETVAINSFKGQGWPLTCQLSRSYWSPINILIHSLLISVYPRNKNGQGNFTKKGTSSADWMIKKGTLCAHWGIEKGTFAVFVPLLPPPPTHTHQRDSYILCLYIVFAPLPIQHSFLCSFKWMSLLKTVPQPKKILCSLFTYLVFVPLKICHKPFAQLSSNFMWRILMLS